AEGVGEVVAEDLEEGPLLVVLASDLGVGGQEPPVGRALLGVGPQQQRRRRERQQQRQRDDERDDALAVLPALQQRDLARLAFGLVAGLDLGQEALAALAVDEVGLGGVLLVGAERLRVVAEGLVAGREEAVVIHHHAALVQ